MIEIIVPRLGWSMEEGAFVAWLKKDGETVRPGDLLFSIEGDKAIQEIESIDGGVLSVAPSGPLPGAPIRVGDLLGYLLSPDEVASLGNRPERPAPRLSASAEQGAATPWAGPAATAGVSPEEVQQARRGEETPAISPRARRVAGELGVDWTKLTGSGRTGRIRERDVRAATAPLRPDGSEASDTGSVLVTGGCGFIGSWVVRDLLARGLRVVVLDAGPRPSRWGRLMGAAHEKVKLVQGSLLDRDLVSGIFARERVTRVIHLAALLTPACQADPWEGCQVNVMGTMALLEQLRAAGDRVRGFSYASSVAVFGDEPDHLSGAAAGGHAPLTFYGAFKRAVELLADQYWRHFHLASVGVRPQVVYGPEREVGLTAGPSLAARAAAAGAGYHIGYQGKVGYDYVEDVARAFVRCALETPPGAQLVDLPGETAEVAQVIAAIEEAAPGVQGQVTAGGPPLPAHAPPAPRFISELFPDWQTTSLSAGMRRTVEFYRNDCHPDL